MIAKEGIPFVLIAIALTVLSIWMANRFNSITIYLVSLVFGMSVISILFFFRDPERVPPSGDSIVLSPADGRIVTITPAETDQFIGGEAVRISIFLSVFNVHVNRIPVAGEINYVHHNAGKFFAAFEEKASKLNEQTDIGITDYFGRRLRFKQIAGLIARRIVCYLKEGQKVEAGDRFGLIRFGSRMDVILPAGSVINVKVGDKVEGGSSILATLPEILNTTQKINEERSQDGH